MVDATFEVQDEYTYYASGEPRVSGSTVRLLDPDSGLELKRQVTGSSGLAVFTGTREGFYDVETTAEGHQSSRQRVLITAGEENHFQVFLTRTTVRYTFNVEPVDFQDQVRVTVETTFETAVPIPVVTMTPETIDFSQFVERWNNTLLYRSQGITLLTQLQPGMSSNFIANNVLLAALQPLASVHNANANDGYDSTLDFAGAAMSRLRESLTTSSGTVCAQVKLRLDQDAVTTREGFRATLELANATTNQLRLIGTELTIQDDKGTDQASLFAILNPEIVAMGNVSGTGSLDGNSTGRATWLIVPTQEAVPSPVPRSFYIGGQLRYTQDGSVVTVPLTAAPITVHPTPRLSLYYFHERAVFADDPQTPAIEPSLPYALGVLVQNKGFGAARGFRLTSGQPKIVENEKGLAIDFKLIATEVAGQALVPSLTASFGNIPPGGTQVGRFLFTSSLQGEFIDYNARFENIGPLRVISVSERSANGGSVRLSGRTILYAPLAENDSEDSFTYTLSDGTTTAVAKVVVRTGYVLPVVENVLSVVVCSNSRPTLRMKAHPGQTVEIQFSESLIDPHWMKLQAITADGQGLVEHSDVDASAQQTRFYRAVISP